MILGVDYWLNHMNMEAKMFNLYMIIIFQLAMLLIGYMCQTYQSQLRIDAEPVTGIITESFEKN